jgi:hypothetical protein
MPLFLYVSCLKPKEYPIEPIIEFSKLQKSGDALYIYINFTDGDGDIGLDENENQPPYNPEGDFYYNYFAEYYEKVNGNWVRGTDVNGDPVSFNYRISKLTPQGNNKALRGEIRVYLNPTYYNPFSPDSDTVMFKIKIADRALHLSNQIETPEITR